MINDLMKLKLRNWRQIDKDRKAWNYLVQETIKNVCSSEEEEEEEEET